MIIKSKKVTGTWQICAAGEETLHNLLEKFGIQISPSGDEGRAAIDRKQVDDLARREIAAERRAHQLDGQLTDANDLIAELTKELANTKANLDNAKAGIRGSIEENEKLSARLRESKAQRVELEKKIAFLEEENAELEDRVKKATSRAVNAETELAAATPKSPRGSGRRADATASKMRALARRIDDQSKSAKTKDAALAMRICAKAIRDELATKEQAA